ncbi:hypothetical protein NLJ89_g5180 [Agrocybe chaxingu]|uniref:Uncharacterized protein n=1 Tax=Agrocybe chaxingu TaxID=84603 RepID=A0A9W8K7Q0_9AGAR|nr:hypothetical protein NLJ89_g5180 [Agrocybe chaxingu]
MQLISIIAAFLTLALAALAATPSIREPADGTIVNPGTTFDFSYQSIADYGASSYNYTVWLFTSPPTTFVPFSNYAAGYYFGRYAEPNYPGNPNPRNLPPKQLTMPNFAVLEKGFGTGSNVHNATFFLTILEEYGTGDASVGYRISLVYNHIRYNVTL